MNRVLYGVFFIVPTFVVGCSEAKRSGEPLGDGLTVRVAPLELPGVSNVDYTLGVYAPSGAGYQLVWTKDNVESDDYGDGFGDITYIGPCDAQGQADGYPACPDPEDCDAASEQLNWVVLDINTVYVGGSGTLSEPADWVNPCSGFSFDSDADPTTAECVLAIMCAENEDAQVAFNLTIMRSASQGFFDVAVTFEDVFCSAKFDTCRADDEPIQLLFRDDDDDGDLDTRWDTGVLAFACTGGPGADTNLYMDNVTIACFPDVGTPYTVQLDPSQDLAGNVDAPVGQDVVFGYATYFGKESLDCGDGIDQFLQSSCTLDGTTISCDPGVLCVTTTGAPECVNCGTGGNICPASYECVGTGDEALCVRQGVAGESCAKKYWNVAIGFDTDELHALDDTCTIYASATASDGQFTGPQWETPDETKYPIVRFAVNLAPSETNGDLTLACGQWGLDETPGAGVYTEYSSLACNGRLDQEFSQGYADDCDFCHRMNSTPDHPIESTRAECLDAP